MRSSYAARLVPVVILAVGLALTGIVVSQRADSTKAEQAEAEQTISRMMTAVAGEAEQKIVNQADVIDRLARVVGAAQTPSEAQRLVNNAGTFERGSPIVAVFADVEGQVTRYATGDNPDGAPQMPAVADGLSRLNRGLWHDMLAYGYAIDADLGAEVVVILDPVILSTSSVENGLSGTEAKVVGLPGTDSELVNSEELVELKGGALSGPSGVYMSRAVTFLGAPVEVQVRADPSMVWEPSSNEVLYLALGGLFLSVLAAVLAHWVSGKLGRAMFEADRADAARKAAAERFAASFVHAPIGVVELGPQGEIIAVNPRFASQLGYTTDELVGRDALDLLDGEDRPPAQRRLELILSGGVESDQAERRYRNRNGAAVWVRESMSVLASTEEGFHVLVQAEDISDERRARAELHRKALFDDLTGLPNRANLIARLNRAVDGERQPGEMLAVMFVDLDKFKEVNDTMGHEAGDRLLIEVATRLKHACRSTDTVARLGGDEFVVVCEGLPGNEAAEQTADRFAAALRDPTVINGAEVLVSASIGLVINSEETDPESILRQADQAMYRAKTSGRDQLVRFGVSGEPAGEASQGSALGITAECVTRAVDENELRIHYQPIVQVASGDIVGLDALVRWQHPEHGLLAPDQFLSDVEEFGLIEDLDRWVIEEGLSALSRWQEASDSTASWFMVFNLSPINYNRRGFVDVVATQLDKTGVEAHRVVLERTETWFMNQTATAVMTTRALRALGVRVSLDHFGTGGSELSDVSTLEFDILKIDRSFLRDATDQNRDVLEALKRMADELGLKAVIEGLETESELRVVKKAGIDLAQGFHFSRPLDELALIGAYLGEPAL